jgi:hypothetical protein
VNNTDELNVNQGLFAIPGFPEMPKKAHIGVTSMGDFNRESIMIQTLFNG